MRKNHILILVALSFIALMTSSVFAAPAPPVFGINEQTKECSEFHMGDECVLCTLPEGWQMIEEFQCPTGYEEIEEMSVCRPLKNFFCCTVGHSGASGDCEDVVVNDVEEKCAFVEDINECEKLPKNWKKPEEIKTWGRLCPDYEWLENPLSCETKIIEDKKDDDQNNDIDDKEPTSNTIPNIAFFAGIIVVLIVLWLFLIRRR